jgi:hypothetical protein
LKIETDTDSLNSGTSTRMYDVNFQQTRCPSCSKLYSVEPIKAGSEPLVFECNSCQTQFMVEAAEFDGIDLPSRVLNQTEPIKNETPEIDANQIANEIALGAKPELILLWKKIIDDYEEEILHEGFIEACLKADALGYAGSKYGRILAEFPNEPLAYKMRKKIQILAAAEIDARNLARQRAKAREAAALPPKSATLSLTSIAIVLGTILVLAGLVLHGQRNVFAVGVAMLALVIGVRFFYQRSSSFD